MFEYWEFYLATFGLALVLKEVFSAIREVAAWSTKTNFRTTTELENVGQNGLAQVWS